jgi:hypothetical protein
MGVAVGFVAGGETEWEASECGSGRERLGARDCKQASGERTP